jgi:hypothetical protein
MSPDTPSRFALYPMVEEADATGVVAGVYAALLEQMPFVPSLFKSFAVCPPYLVIAHEQASGVLGLDAFSDTAAALAASVHDETSPPEQAEVRETLAEFVQPLSRMLLLASGLWLALHDELEAPPAPGTAPAPRPVRPSAPAPTAREASHEVVYGEIRAQLATPMINTIWRRLAERGQLAAAWLALQPQAAGTVRPAGALGRRALGSARELAWPVAASPAALAASGIPDAVPGMAAVLDAYLVTLPRVLVLASSSA